MYISRNIWNLKKWPLGHLWHWHTVKPTELLLELRIEMVVKVIIIMNNIDWDGFWWHCYIEILVIIIILVMMKMLTWDVLNTSSVWDDKAIELCWKGDWNLNVNMGRIQTSLCYQRHFTFPAVSLSLGFHFWYFTFRISSQWEICSISGRR